MELLANTSGVHFDVISLLLICYLVLLKLSAKILIYFKLGQMEIRRKATKVASYFRDMISRY